MHPGGVVGVLGAVLAVLVVVVGAERKHECDRVCRESDAPRDCYYHFTLSVSLRRCVDDGHESCLRRLAVTINGQTPGPVVAVCRNDTVTVDVRNALPSGLETSIHWHGLRQRDTPHMDGVPMLTQCPIHSGTTFRYRMLADRAGTFYYRAHSVLQQLDGLFGAFIVSEAKRPRGRLVVVAPVLDGLVSTDADPLTDVRVSDMRATVYDDADETGVVRLINAAATDCPVRVTGESMTVIAGDGNPVVPVGTDNIAVYPGERLDLRTSGGQIGLIGGNLCEGYAIHESGTSWASGVRLQELQSGDVSLERTRHRVHLPFDLSTYSTEDNPVDFRYKLSERVPYVPSYINGIHDRGSVYEFRNVSFLYPASPVLSQPRDIDPTILCRSEKPRRDCDVAVSSRYCECLQVVDLPYNASVDLIIHDEGRRGRSEQVLHLHGHTFRALYTGRLSGPVTDVRDVIDESGWNFMDPAEKDTVVVPNPGYVVLRLKTDNPGDWLLESVPSKARSGIGLEIVLRVPGRTAAAPGGFPQCGTLKPPDLVIFQE